MFPSRSRYEAHIGPTATYDNAICLGFPTLYHSITDTRIQHLIQSAYNCLNTIHQRKIHVWVQTTIRCLSAKVKHTKPTSTRVQALRRGPLASRRRVFAKASKNGVATHF